jgi:hypothetical protein
VAIPADRKVAQKEVEQKINTSLCIDLEPMWNMICMSVVTGASGMATKGLKKNLEAIQGKHSIDPLQKTAVLGTSHIIRKVLQSET